MTLSRVESKKREEQNKRRSKKAKHKLWLVNISLLAIILIVMAVFYRGEQVWNAAKNQLISLGVIQQEQLSTPDIHNADNQPIIISDLPEVSGDSEEENLPSEDEAEVENNVPTENTEEQSAHTIGSNEQSQSSVVNLAFVGDILQGEYIQAWLDQEGYSYPFQNAMFHLTSADITAGNLEMPITKRGIPAEDKTFVFKGAPEGLQGLKDAGIDIVSLANNHTLDQGVEGMLDTMKYLDEYGIKHTGAGNNADEAYTPIVQEVNGIKLAYFGITRVVPDTNWKANKYSAGLAEAYDPTLAIRAIEEAEKDNDITVVMIHWGKERQEKPEAYQLDLARKFIDAGADIIIGSHPHVLQGFEQYNGKWIAYSLGNFVFNSHPKGKQAETGVLGAVCDNEANCELSFYPMRIQNAQPTPIEGEEARELLSFLQEVSFGNVAIDEKGLLTSP